MSNTSCICILNNPKNTDGTCLPADIIKNIAKDEGINPANTKTKIIEDLSTKYECNTANKELCILAKSKIDNVVKLKLDQEYFKPYASSLTVDYWLNNSEIDSALRQFQLTFKNFAYSFIHMSDLIMFPPSNLQALPHPIYQVTDIDFGNEFMKQSKLITEEPLRYYGVIFNTDTSDGSGQHWFCVFIDYDEKNKKCSIELFNSSGEDIDSDKFNKFWIKTALDIEKKTGLKTLFKKVSNIQHQNDKTGSCGAYALFYIYARLNGVTSAEFDNKKRLITDDEMTKFRAFLFRDRTPID